MQPAKAIAGVVAGLCASITAFSAHADSETDRRIESLASELAALKTENEQLRTLIPSQSHAMMDVAFQFTNLWFAGQAENWPLAQFYLNEARSHIKWTIRLSPTRKTKAGEIRLQEIFYPIDTSLFAEVQKQIAAQDRKQFSTAYRAALAGCNSCHTASEKPYLHVVVPTEPENHIVDFKPTGSPK